MFVHSAAGGAVEGPVGSDVAQRAQVQETLAMAVGQVWEGPWYLALLCTCHHFPELRS